MRPSVNDRPGDETTARTRRRHLLPDPVDPALAERASTGPAFEELFHHIVAVTPPPSPGRSEPPWAPGPRHGRRYLLAGVAAVALLATVLPIILTSRSGGLTKATVTPFHAPTPFVPPSASGRRVRSGRWQLLGAVLSGTWIKNTDGPPAGPLTCASADACYVLAGHYPSPDANAPLLSESLYATGDLGSTWTVTPMPTGFDATSRLSCPEPSHCDVGGTLAGRSAFLSTVDGGSQWTVTPLPIAPGVLLLLSCPSPDDCSGVVGPTWAQHLGTLNPADTVPAESSVTTADGGKTWKATAMDGEDLALDLDCTTIEHCVLSGEVWDPEGASIYPTPFVRATTDGGRSWIDGAFPRGFSVNADSAGLSCPDAQDCFVNGLVPITIANPPECQTAGAPPASSPPSRPADGSVPAMSPAVAAISSTESSLASQAAAQEATDGGGFSCAGTGPNVQPVSVIASSTDAGRTWVVDQMPADVPDPQLNGLSCPTRTECWASGSELVLERVGRATSAESPVLLGTTDGGATWSRVVFTVPSNAPDAYGQSYLSIGAVACPTANACIAHGATAQSSPTSPVYSVVSAPGP